MSDHQIRNAKITKAVLGVEDHGILTASIVLEWSGGGAIWGGYALDRYDKRWKARVGTAWGLTFILRVMETIGVSKWSDLEGKYVRVIDRGWGSTCGAIGHITNEKWLDVDKDEVLKALVGEA